MRHPVMQERRLIDVRLLRRQGPYVYRDRAIERARRHPDLGTVYLFKEARRRGEQLNTLKRKLAEEDTSHDEFEQN